MCSEAGRGGEEDFDDETPTKDHVVLRVQVERLSFPAEFWSRNQLAFAANLQIKIPIVLSLVLRCAQE
jgi:hypothetical protein